MRKTFEQQLRVAEKHLSRGRHTKALAVYRRLLARRPDDRRCLRRVADLAAAAGAEKEASSALRKLACQYAEDGFAEKAIAVYKRLIRLDPADLKLRLELCRQYEKSGQRYEAVAELSGLAAELEIRDSPAVLDVYRRLIDLNPGLHWHRVRLAKTYWKYRLYAQAIEQLQQLQVRLEGFEQAELVDLYLEIAGADRDDRRSINALISDLLRAGDEVGASRLMANYLPVVEAETPPLPATPPEEAEPREPSGRILPFPVPAEAGETTSPNGGGPLPAGGLLERTDHAGALLRRHA